MYPISIERDWFDSHQYFALWLEGLALVLIFIWDRIDAFQQHKQTLEQLKIANKSAEAVINSERAWVVAELVPICLYFDRAWHRPSGDSYVRLSATEHFRGDHLKQKLKLTNMGQTPAHVLRYSIGYSREVDTTGTTLRLVDGFKHPEIEFDRLIGGTDSIDVAEIDIAEYIRNFTPTIGGPEATGIISGKVKYQHVFSDTDVVEVSFNYLYIPSAERLNRIPARKPEKGKDVT